MGRPGDCVELRGLGQSGVPMPRTMSAKQRSLDPSLLELGIPERCWSRVGAWPEPEGFRGKPGKRGRRRGQSPETHDCLLLGSCRLSHRAAGDTKSRALHRMQQGRRETKVTV